MEIELNKKIFSIFGLNLSGKSYFVKNAIIPSYKCLVFDPNGEYDSGSADVYIPKKKSYPGIAFENEEFLEKFVKKNHGYDLLIFDEADSVFPNKKPLMSNMDSLKGKYRHSEWGELGIGFICRRPAQIFTDFPSLSHFIFSFGNKGAPDIQRLNAESQGLGDLVSTLSNYNYVIVNQDRTFKKMPPI
jgi:hypothetical protein